MKYYKFRNRLMRLYNYLFRMDQMKYDISMYYKGNIALPHNFRNRLTVPLQLSVFASTR